MTRCFDGGRGLSLATARKLEQASADPQSRGAAKPVQPISLRPDTIAVKRYVVKMSAEWTFYPQLFDLIGRLRTETTAAG